MKPLTDLAVLQTAEDLMFKNGQTTTLDVKNALRLQNYEAMQNEVSARMENLCRQESWQTNNGGAYRIYKPALDTIETMQAYWELATQKIFWEIKITQNNVQLVTGQIADDGQTQTLAYRSNREAIRQGQLLMQEKRQEGYQPAKDSRLPLAIRQHFQDYFGKTLATVRLAYYGASQARTREVRLFCDGEEQQGKQEESRQGGYEFEWHLPTEKAQLQHVWEKDVWSPLYYQTVPVACLGEKVEYKNFVDSQSVTPLKILQEMAWKPTHFFEVKKSLLFQAKLTFSDDTILRVNRYESVFAEKNNTRQPSASFWATVQRFLQ